jgi:cobalt-zinc-cadmium resistance protein CzcA
MPKLEEGNVWIRTTLPQDVSFDYAARLADEMRSILRFFPEVQHIISQTSRPRFESRSVRGRRLATKTS